MAQVPPHLGPEYRTLFQAPVSDVLHSNDERETVLDLGEGVYVLHTVDGALEGGLDDMPDLRLYLRWEILQEDGWITMGDLIRLTMNGAERRDQVELGGTPITGPGRLRFRIANTISDAPDAIAGDPYEDAFVSVQLGLDHHSAALAEYVSEGGLSDYMQDPDASLEEAFDGVPVETDDGTDPPHFPGQSRYQPIGAGIHGDVGIADIPTERPEDPAEGTLFFDEDRNRMMVYSGAQWEDIREEDGRLFLEGAPMPRLTGVRERRHMPFWDELHGDRGSDTTIVIGGPDDGPGIGLVERTDQTWYDTYLCDAARGSDFCPQHMLTGHKKLFQNPSRDPLICNVPNPGAVPHGHAMLVQELGLGLAFSDPALFALAFRYIRVELYVMEHPQRDVHAREWLAEAVEEDHDFDPSLGFAWKLELERPVMMPPASGYYAYLRIAEPLVKLLREAEEALQRFHNTGEWESPEHEARFSGWYAEIRVMLCGQRTNRVQ
jgi:hypothetical protein